MDCATFRAGLCAFAFVFKQLFEIEYGFKQQLIVLNKTLIQNCEDKI